MPEPWTVEIDRAACMGTGTCMVYAGGTFEYDPDGKAALRAEPTDDLDAVRAAVEACPTSALRLVDDEP
jgi:ferredoxin